MACIAKTFFPDFQFSTIYVHTAIPDGASFNNNYQDTKHLETAVVMSIGNYNGGSFMSFHSGGEYDLENKFMVIDMRNTFTVLPSTTKASNLFGGGYVDEH